ncbi:MAG: hypothetical protein PHV13_05485 [Candidatus ainarchaeum sp.]|nr:hypothetical protein [Candidatus ainarchaeum sp.]
MTRATVRPIDAPSARVRLIFSPDLCTAERRAVLGATRAFAKFNVSFDHVRGQKSLVEEETPRLGTACARIRRTRRGEEINAMVVSTRAFCHEITAPFSGEDPWAGVYSRSSLGMGVTPHEIVSGFNPYPGIVRTGEAGVVSTRPCISLPFTQKLAGIQAVVTHYLGRLLGNGGDCKDCLMAAWAVHGHFIKEVAESGLGICAKCQDEIRGWIRSQGGGRA